MHLYNANEPQFRYISKRSSFFTKRTMVKYGPDPDAAEVVGANVFLTEIARFNKII